MTDEKICPFLSTPLRAGDPLLKSYLFEVPCLRERCAAWVPTVYRCQIAWADYCPDADGPTCDFDTCPKCVKVVHEEGYCKLIERR